MGAWSQTDPSQTDPSRPGRARAPYRLDSRNTHTMYVRVRSRTNGALKSQRTTVTTIEAAKVRPWSPAKTDRTLSCSCGGDTTKLSDDAVPSAPLALNYWERSRIEATSSSTLYLKIPPARKINIVDEFHTKKNFPSVSRRLALCRRVCCERRSSDP